MLGPSARAESGPCRCGGCPPTNLQEPPSPNPHLCLVTALDIEANLSLSLQQNKHSSLQANKKNIKTPSSTTRQQTASLPQAAPEPRPTQGQQWPSRTVQEPEAQGPSVGAPTSFHFHLRPPGAPHLLSLVQGRILRVCSPSPSPPPNHYQHLLEDSPAQPTLPTNTQSQQPRAAPLVLLEASPGDGAPTGPPRRP